MRHSDFQSRFEGGIEVKIYSDNDPPLHMFDFWCQNCIRERNAKVCSEINETTF